MSAGFKPEFNAYLSHLVTTGRGKEAERFVEGVRESSRKPSPVVLGENEIIPTPDVVLLLIGHVFEGPPNFELFIRRWFTDAQGIHANMTLAEQARTLFRYYHPRHVTTVIRDFYPEPAASFVPPPTKARINK